MPWRRQVAGALAMELQLRDSIPAVSLAAAAAALYARAASSLLRTGFPRLVALLPVLALLAAAPLAFASSAIVRGVAAFFLAWLGAFKVALLAAGRGPLDPSLPVLPFLFTALLPVKLRRGGAGGAASQAKAALPSLVSCAVKAAVMAALVSLYRLNARLHLYARLALYGVHTYCFLDLLLPCVAAAAAALGMETEPQFDRPVPGLLAAGLLGPPVEPHGVGHPPAVGVRPRARARRDCRGRPGLVRRVRGDARGHGVLPQPAVAPRRRDGRLLRPPRRLLRRRGVVRAAVGGEEAAAARRGDGVCGGVRGGLLVLALLPGAAQGRRRGAVPGRVGCRGGLLPRRRREDFVRRCTVNGVASKAIASMKAVKSSPSELL